MPSGKTHLKIEIALLAAGTAGVIVLYREGLIAWHEGGVFLGAYLFSSLLLSPDLDLARSRASRHWGLGRILWLPYAMICRHRRLSHHLFFGPLSRILYLGAIGLSIFLGFSLLAGRSLTVSLPSWRLLVPIFTGLYLPNQIHILVDRFSSFFRRKTLRQL